MGKKIFHKVNVFRDINDSLIANSEFSKSKEKIKRKGHFTNSNLTSEFFQNIYQNSF